MSYWLYHGDCVEVMKTWPENSVDAVVCDPPYGLEFMGKTWDRCDTRQPFRGEVQTPDNPFGRTPVRYGGSPSYGQGRTSKPGIGERSIEWPSNRGWNQTRCANCGHLSHGGSPCVCPNPSFVAADDRWLRMQEWHLQWACEALRVLKPGGYLLSFGGTRTYHRMVCAVEDAGFEIRDSLHWFYGSGMIKSRNVARDMDRMQCVLPGRHYTENLPKGAKARPGDHRCPELPENAEQYGHIGTAVAPGHEPVCLARKPMVGTVAKNVLQYGTGGLDVDGCALETTDSLNGGAYSGGERPNSMMGCTGEAGGTGSMLEAGSKRLGPDEFEQPDGRRPKNVLLSHADGCVCTGTRPVRQNGAIAPGTAAAEGNGSSRVALGDLGRRGTWKAHPGEMEAWECIEGCPVAELDRQAEGRSRYFKTFAYEAPFLYQAKPSRSERDFGCEQFPAKTAGEATGREDDTDGLKSPRAGAGRTGGKVLDAIGQVLYPSALWVFEVLSRALPADMVSSLRRVTFGSTIQCSDGSVWSMCWCGSPSTDPSRPGIRSITGTRTSWITESKTWSASPQLHTNGCMADAFGVTAVGGSPAGFAK